MYSVKRQQVRLWHLRHRIMMKVVGEPSTSFPGTVSELLALAGHLQELGHDVSCEGYALQPVCDLQPA